MTIRKSKPPKATKPPKKPVDVRPGDMAPIRYPDTAGKRFGNWLMGLLTLWKQ